MRSQLEMFIGLSLIVAGLSHVIQPRAWVDFFLHLRSLGSTGAFVAGWMHLPLGLLIVSLHPVYHGLPMLLTLIGWAWTTKGTLYFLFPRVCLKSLSHISVDRVWVFGIGGWLLVGLGLLVGYSSLVS